MTKKGNKSTYLCALGLTAITSALGGGALVNTASAAVPDGFSVLGTGYQVRSNLLGQLDPVQYADNHEKSAEGKCGEGKCGGGKKDEAKDKSPEGKCGEGKCGGGDVKKDKAPEGKCGEGKCGGGKE